MNYFDISRTLLPLSNCLKRQYACVIVSDGRIIATGRNESLEACTTCARIDVDHNTGDYADCGSVHAEAMALINARKKLLQGAELYLVCSDEVDPIPCPTCQKLLDFAGVKQVREVINRLAEGTEASLEESKADEGGIVREGGDKGVETEELNKECEVTYHCFGTYENNENTFCGTCRESEICQYVTKNHPEETKDDLEGLAEPEPEWNSEYVRTETPDQMWLHVAYYIGAIKQQGIRQVEEDIQARLDQILGGR